MNMNDVRIVSSKPHELKILLDDGTDFCRKIGISNVHIDMDNKDTTAKLQIDYFGLDVVAGKATCYVIINGRDVEIKGFIDVDGKNIFL